MQNIQNVLKNINETTQSWKARSVISNALQKIGIKPDFMNAGFILKSVAGLAGAAAVVYGATNYKRLSSATKKTFRDLGSRIKAVVLGRRR